jgi:hypothetical protein
MTTVSECQKTIDALRQKGPIDDPELLRHAQQCEPCAALLADQAQLGLALMDAERLDVGPDLAALRSRLDAGLQAERGVRAWLSSRPTTLRYSLAVASVLLLPLAVLVGTPRPDLSVYPLLRLGGTMVVYAGVALWLSLAALAPAQRPLPSSGRRLTFLALAAAVPILVALSPMAHSAHAASLAGAGADLVPRALACFSFGSALALPLVLLLSGMERGVSPRARWLVGAGGGLAGVAAVELHCPITQPVHLVLGHATLAVAWLALCALSLRFARAR